MRTRMQTHQDCSPSHPTLARPKVGQHYGPHGSALYWLEPHVAELTFAAMLAEAGVTRARHGQVVNTYRGDSGEIARVEMEDGTVHAATVFVDGSYEGDLMARANISYTWGRETLHFLRSTSMPTRKSPLPL